MGVQESNAARCEDVQGHKPDEEQTQESANAYVIKRWFRKYVHKHYNYKFTLSALQSIAQEYILYHKIPELSEYQIFIILFKYYNELIESGKITITHNEEKNEDNLNDLEADTNGGRTESVANSGALGQAQRARTKSDANSGRTDANSGRTESESVAKSIKEEQRLTFSVSDITLILSAYQNKVMNKDLNDLEAVAKSIKEEHALVDFRVPDIALILFTYQIKMKHDQD